MTASTAPTRPRRDPAMESAKARRLANAHRAVCPVRRPTADLIIRR